ncbi:MAG TPA: PAS domain-containing sensor histidine kinase, partial [Bacteroidetes bacterium]|nr:PAS domain-containing sensor histidine kinase [Bacteroidota bacterium]
MKQATADLLVKNKSVILQKWVDSIRENNAVRATIPSASLAQVVEELYLYVLESFRQDKNAIKHFDRVLTLVQKPVLPETRFGLQVLLNHGKRKMFDLLEESLPAGGDLARVFRAIDACFDDISLHVVSECEKSQVTEDDGAAHAGEDELTPHSRLNLFYSAFLNSTDAIIITNLHGKITEANTAFLELFGYSHDEVIGRTTSFLRSSRTSDELYRQMWTSLEEKGEWKGEIYNRTKHGEEIPVWLSITSVYEDDKRVGYMGFEIDMRPQKKLEKRILQSERLAVIGKMAAKVAHEIRNPLSSISLNTEL